MALQKILDDKKIKYELVEPEDFSHSLTREKAIKKSKADVVVLITQDVDIRNDDWLEKLVTPIINGEVEATYSRQLTKYNNIEKYTREFNYPDKSEIRSKEDIEKYGLKTFFSSDTSFAIKRKIFVELNGYDEKDLPVSEDMYITYKLIMNGYKIKYCSDSIVYHSHNYTVWQVYKRYILNGKFFKQNKYLEQYGVGGSGSKMAKYILKGIIRDKNIKLLFRYPFDMAARLIGMKVGKM